MPCVNGERSHKGMGHDAGGTRAYRSTARLIPNFVSELWHKNMVLKRWYRHVSPSALVTVELAELQMLMLFGSNKALT